MDSADWPSLRVLPHILQLRLQGHTIPEELCCDGNFVSDFVFTVGQGGTKTRIQTAGHSGKLRSDVGHTFC